MIIFGDKELNDICFCKIFDKDEITSTKPGSILLFDYNKSLAIYCKDNDLKYSMKINTIKELMYANTLLCSYAFVKIEFASQAQSLANEYLFDMKIILPVKNDEEFVWAAKNGIDGVMLSIIQNV